MTNGSGHHGGPVKKPTGRVKQAKRKKGKPAAKAARANGAKG